MEVYLSEDRPGEALEYIHSLVDSLDKLYKATPSCKIDAPRFFEIVRPGSFPLHLLLAAILSSLRPPHTPPR